MVSGPARVRKIGGAIIKVSQVNGDRRTLLDKLKKVEAKSHTNL